MRVLLIYPDHPGLGIGLDPFAWRAEPLPLETLASHIKGEHEVRIMDLRFEKESLWEVMDKFQPEVVGVTGHITEAYRMIDICRTVKALSPTTVTLVGGHFATQTPYAFDQNGIDAVVLGEGEVTFPLVLRAIEKREEWRNIAGLAVNLPEGGQKITGVRPLIEDINKLPIPDRYRQDIVRENYNLFLERPHTICEFTRGCVHRCTFCSVHKYNRGKYRQMNVERIIQELETIKEKSIAFIDDNFFCNIKRARELAQAIIGTPLSKKHYFLFGSAELVANNPGLIELWKRAGLTHFYIGFESITEEIGFNKKVTLKENLKALDILRSLDIVVYISFIVAPNFTKDDFRRLVEFCNKYEIIYPLFPILVPFPGTDIYIEGKLKGDILTENYELYDFLHLVFPSKIPREEFYEEYSKLYRAIGDKERKMKVRLYTLKKSFRLKEVRSWWKKIVLAKKLLQLWNDMGKRMGESHWYLKDDLKEPLRPPRKGFPQSVEIKRESCEYDNYKKESEIIRGCSRIVI